MAWIFWPISPSNVAALRALRPPRLNPSTSHARRVYTLPIRHTCIPSMDALGVEYHEWMRKYGAVLPTTLRTTPPPAPVKLCVPNPAARHGGVRFRPTSTDIRQREIEKEENLWGCSVRTESIPSPPPPASLIWMQKCIWMRESVSE
ncbi:hypothetical protein B0H14DRAFT_2640386 [Mycena olivaceomarginata]|nr:hypothetical protein B0H14DRAFT_2640386 [Mycena olivaceomarginata]